MRVHPDDPRLQEPGRRKPAPIEYAGQWVAWDDLRESVVSAGVEIEAVYNEAIAAGVKSPLLEKVPRPNTLRIPLVRCKTC